MFLLIIKMRQKLRSRSRKFIKTKKEEKVVPSKTGTQKKSGFLFIIIIEKGGKRRSTFKTND